MAATGRDSHISPLAPPQIYRRSDDEWDIKIFEKSHHFPRIKRRKTGKCFVYLFTITVFLCIAVLVFATVFLRAAHPKLSLESVHVNRLSSGVTSNLNLTAAAELKLSNGNFGRYRFRPGSLSVVFGNITLGKAEIESGVVLGRKSARIKAVVQMKVDDKTARNLVKMKWFAELRGEVRVVKIMSSHRTSFMNCSLSLNLSSKAVQDLLCY